MCCLDQAAEPAADEAEEPATKLKPAPKSRRQAIAPLLPIFLHAMLDVNMSIVFELYLVNHCLSNRPAYVLP
jgi:hypothetical protein